MTPRIPARLASILVLCLCACSDHDRAAVTAVEVQDPLLKPTTWMGDADVIAAIVTPPLVLTHIPTRDTLGRLMQSIEVVHPSVACSSAKGFQCYMMMTPYPWGMAQLENASVLRGIDTITWTEPKTARNPIVPQVPKGWSNNSDPDLNWDAGARRFFFSNRLASNDSNVVSVFGSADAVRYTPARRIIAVPSHQVISPSFTVGHDGEPRIYSVKAVSCGDDFATVEVRRPLRPAKRYEDINWGTAETVTLDQPGFVPWHLEIRWVPSLSLYVGLIVAHPFGGFCSDDDLFVVTSVDGVHFNTYPHPIMWRKNPWMKLKAVYRSTFVFDDSRHLLRLWISAYTSEYQWRLMYATVSWDDLMVRLEDLKRLPDSAGTNPNAAHGAKRGGAPAVEMP